MAGNVIMSSEAAAWHATWLRERPDDYGADVLAAHPGRPAVRAIEYLHSQQMRTLVQQDFATAFEQRGRGRRADGAAGARRRIGRTFEPGGPFNAGAARDRQPR